MSFIYANTYILFILTIRLQIYIIAKYTGFKYVAGRVRTGRRNSHKEVKPLLPKYE